jgi:hypothetical protein
MLEDKLRNNRINCYGDVLRLNKERITKKVLNMKLKGKRQRGRLRSRREQQVRKRVLPKQRWRNMGGNCLGFQMIHIHVEMAKDKEVFRLSQLQVSRL